MTSMIDRATLDPAQDPAIDRRSRAFLEELNKDSSPFWELPGDEPRNIVTALQNQTPVDLSGIEIDRAPDHRRRPDASRCTSCAPRASTGTLPVFMFFHGAVWIAGNFENHKRLVRDLVVGLAGRGRVRRVHAGARGPVPRPDRPGLRGHRVGQPARRRHRRRQQQAGRRGQQRRRQHGRRRHADGPRQGRREHRLPAAAVARARHRPRHRLLPRLRRGPLPAARVHGSTAGTTTPPTPRRASTATPPRCRPRSSSSAACRRRSSRPPRTTCCATRARPTRASSTRPAWT